MEAGYFFYFKFEEELRKFLKYKKIDSNLNLFFCIDDNTFFPVIKKHPTDNNNYYEIRLNNILYYIDLNKSIVIDSNKYSLEYFSLIRHRKLKERILELYYPIKEKNDSIGKIYEIKEECKANKYISNQEIILAKSNNILLIDMEEDYCIIAKVYSNSNPNRTPIYEENKNEIYGYIDLNYLYKIAKDLLIIKLDTKIEINKSLLERIANIKQEREKKEFEKQEIERKKTEKRENQIKKSKEMQQNKKKTITLKKTFSSELHLKDITVYVRKRLNSCTNFNHNIKECIGKMMLINKSGNVVEKDIMLFYCSNCGKYYLSELDYENLLRHGKPFCRIINEEVKNSSNGKMAYLNEESELFSYGYNVNQTEGLTVEQRRKILKLLIDNKLMTKDKIISHLTYLISTRRNMRNFRYAISKWSDDKDYISKYKIGYLEEYNIATIRRKEYK